MHPGRRNFRSVWLSLFTTAMGLMAFLPVLALYVEDEFGIEDPQQVAFWAGLIYGAGPFTAAWVGPIWGAMGDRYGKKRMAVRANLAIAICTAAMPFAESPAGLLAMRIAQGLFAGYVAPAMALGAGQLPKRVHGRVIAQLQVALALGTFAGPYLGAEITGLFGRRALFWFASGLSLVSGVSLWLRATDVAPSAASQEGSFFGGFWRGCVAVLGNRVFALLLLLLLVLRLGQNMLEPMLSLFVRELGPQAWLVALSSTETLALDRTIALAFGILAIGQWIFTPKWGRMADRHGPLLCLIVLSFGLGTLLLLSSFVTTINQFLLLRCGVACMAAGSMTLAFAAISKRVVDEHRTFAFSLVQSGIQFGLALGPLVGAYVARSDAGPDFRSAFVCAAVLCCLAGTGMLLLRRTERRLAA